MPDFAKKISKKSKREAIKKVIKEFRKYDYDKAESYIKKLPGDENRFEWLIKLQWTFGSYPKPEYQHIESLMGLFKNRHDPNGKITYNELHDPVGDSQKVINEAFRRLHWLVRFRTLNDWLDEINSLVDFPTARKEGRDKMIPTNKTFQINKHRQKSFETDLEDNITQLEALKEIFVKVDLIIEKIPNLKKESGSSSEYPLLKKKAKEIWIKNKAKIIENSNYDDGTANERAQVRELLRLYPELQLRANKYENEGDRDNGIPFETVRSWVKEWK